MAFDMQNKHAKPPQQIHTEMTVFAHTYKLTGIKNVKQIANIYFFTAVREKTRFRGEETSISRL